MMQRMRENTKVILWVVVVAFVITIFAVWGLDLQSGSTGQRTDEVGRVNGIPVSVQTYQQIYSQMAQQFRAQSAGELSSAQQEMVREQAWENIVSNIITGEEIKKLGIGVTDEEVLTFLRTSPPQEVQQYFQTKEGTFDYAAYQAALNNPEADWTAVEQLARQRIPVIKLNTYLTAQVHASAADVQRVYDEENVRLIAEYVVFPIDAEDVGGWTPAEAEVTAYYDAHPDQFRDAEKASLEFVRIPIEPSARDRADVLFSAAQIRKDAAAGDFAGVAKTYSEAHTAAVGGETGWIDRSQRDEAVMKAVDALRPEEVSQPVSTPSGVYLVQLIGTRKEKGATQYNLREIFLKLAPGSSTVDSLSGIAQGIRQRAAENGDLSAAAAGAGFKAQTTGAFAAGVVPGLGFVPAVSRFAFAGEVGSVSAVLSDDHNFFVCKSVARTPAAARPLAEVTDAIRQQLVRERKAAQAARKAEALVLSTSTSKASFVKAAGQYGYRIEKTDSFTVAGETPPRDMGPNSAFARAALGMEVGAVGGPIESGSAVYAIHLLGRREPAAAVFKSRGPAILEQIRQQKAQEYVMYWYNQLKEKSKIEDLRESL